MHCTTLARKKQGGSSFIEVDIRLELGKKVTAPASK